MEQTMNSNMQPAKRGIKKSWIILGIVVVLVLWMFSGYNGLVEKQELATTELANVQTQYQRRADMMPQLAKIVNVTFPIHPPLLASLSEVSIACAP